MATTKTVNKIFKKFPKQLSGNNRGTPVKCPICQYQVVRVRSRANGGNGYTICPKCYANPPSNHGGDPSAGGSFPCFRCRHPTCSLATGVKGSDIDVFKCPSCADGKIVFRVYKEVTTIFSQLLISILVLCGLYNTLFNI